ncbi:ABC transporter substrate-binding protein, partial [Streptomyces somaliensis DSM 40738]|nr:ABC transporter substrate-binding protein [Streptomyces somaliensis DSM 40738]
MSGEVREDTARRRTERTVGRGTGAAAPGRGRGAARGLRVLLTLPLLALPLAACGSEGRAGPPVLNWYNFPDD